QDELRNVDDDRRRVELHRRPSPALQRPLNLLHAKTERRVELMKRLRADHAIGIESVPRLKMLHGPDERAVVHGALRIDPDVGQKIAEAAQEAAEYGSGGP